MIVVLRLHVTQPAASQSQDYPESTLLPAHQQPFNKTTARTLMNVAVVGLESTIRLP